MKSTLDKSSTNGGQQLNNDHQLIDGLSRLLCQPLPVHNGLDAVSHHLRLAKDVLRFAVHHRRWLFALINTSCYRQPKQCCLAFYAYLLVRHNVQPSAARYAWAAVSYFLREPLVGHQQQLFVTHHLSRWPSIRQLVEQPPPTREWSYIAGLDRQLLLICQYLSGYSGVMPHPALNSSFHHRMQQLSLEINGSYAQLMSTLLRYPGLYPPGTRVKSAQLDAPELVIIESFCSSTEEMLYLAEKTGEKGAASDVIVNGSLVTLSTAQVSQRVLDGACELVDYCHLSDERIETYRQNKRWALRHPTPTKFRYDVVPNALLDLLTRIDDPQVDIRQLATRLSQHGVASNIVLQTARNQNRLQLPVTDLVQGIMTHGLERLRHVLLEEYLLQRLNQWTFPMQAPLMHFCSFARRCCEHLALQLQTPVPQELTMLMTFYLSGLFLTPEYYVTDRWLLNRDTWLNVDCLAGNKSAMQRSLALAKQWKLTKLQRVQLAAMVDDDLFYRLSLAQQEAVVILQLSFMLAATAYFSTLSIDARSQAMKERSVAMLGLTAANTDRLVEQLCTGHCCVLAYTG